MKLILYPAYCCRVIVFDTIKIKSCRKEYHKIPSQNHGRVSLNQNQHMCATGISEECEGNIDACQGKFSIFEVFLELPSGRCAKLNLAQRRLHVDDGRSHQT